MPDHIAIIITKQPDEKGHTKCVRLTRKQSQSPGVTAFCTYQPHKKLKAMQNHTKKHRQCSKPEVSPTN